MATAIAAPLQSSLRSPRSRLAALPLALPNVRPSGGRRRLLTAERLVPARVQSRRRAPSGTDGTPDMRPDADSDGADSVGVLAEDKFLYFAYGSNLLARRLLILNPTAKRFGVGQLRDYRLDFSTPPSKRWGGAPATVVPDPGEDVWGAIWSLDMKDRDNLDEQEGVGTGWYRVFNATVLTPAGGSVRCRCYMMGVVPAKVSEAERPAERQPSLVYKQVVLAGAAESGLPADYIARLRAVRDNGSPGVDPPVTLESLQQQQLQEAQSTVAAPVAPAAR